MRATIGTIKKAVMNPMVSAVLSWVDITVEFPDKTTHTVTEKDTISNLQDRFGFEIDGDTYKMGSMIGRKCEINTESEYRFLRYA